MGTLARRERPIYVRLKLIAHILDSGRIFGSHRLARNSGKVVEAINLAPSALDERKPLSEGHGLCVFGERVDGCRGHKSLLRDGVSDIDHTRNRIAVQANPRGGNMGLIDWIKNRGRQNPVDPELDPRAHGHKNWKGVFAEQREDCALGKQRDETGREPESHASKAKARRGPSVER
jgi:hypothetical protein